MARKLAAESFYTILTDLNKVNTSILQDLIDRAFKEDVSDGDVTTNAIVDETQQAQAVWVAKEQGIVVGLDVAKQVFEYVDPLVAWESNIVDGTR